MGNKLHATGSGLKKFFSFRGTNMRVDNGNAVLHGDKKVAEKAKIISQLFLAMAIRSTPIGLMGNTIGAIKHGRRRYKELKTMTPQLVQTLTAIGVSPGGINQLVLAIRTNSVAALNLSDHDRNLIAGDLDHLANVAIAQGIDASVIQDILMEIRRDVGTGEINF